MLAVPIAEDEPLSLQESGRTDARFAWRRCLIEELRTGREAVERARQIQPQLVLMDIENAGDERHLMRQPSSTGHAETHIVFLTAFDRFDYAVASCEPAERIIWSSRLTAHRLPPACAS